MKNRKYPVKQQSHNFQFNTTNSQCVFTNMRMRTQKKNKKLLKTKQNEMKQNKNKHTMKK